MALKEEEMEDPGAQENSVVDVLVNDVCQLLNTQTPAQEWNSQTKEAVGLAIRQTISESLTDVVEALKNLEPIMVGIFQGPMAEQVKNNAMTQNTTIGKIVAGIAFDAMSEGANLICRSRGAK